MYKFDDQPFINLITELKAISRENIETELSNKTSIIENIFNLDYAIASPYILTFLNPNIGTPPPRNEILLSAYHRNWFALYASFELTCNGLFGPARSILRHAFESMIIAKFSSLSNNDAIYRKWKDGDTIYFSNNILKKIKKPDSNIFFEFWQTLSSFVHATIHSQQMSFDGDHLSGNIQFNFDLILVLLEWHYHLLTSHIITPSIRWATDYTLTQLGEARIKNLRQLKRDIRSAFKNGRSDMPDFMKRAIRDYKLMWEISENYPNN